MSSQEPCMVFFRLMTRLGGGAQTLAYLLPVLSMALQRAEAEFEALAAQNKSALAGSLQAVVVVPSRELAMQIARVGQSLLPPQARGCVQQAIGGANINRQVLHPVLRGMKLSLITVWPGAVTCCWGQNYVSCTALCINHQVLSPVARGRQRLSYSTINRQMLSPVCEGQVVPLIWQCTLIAKCCPLLQGAQWCLI